MRYKNETLELRNVQLYGEGPLVAVGIKNGMIAYIGEPQHVAYVIDGHGLIALPGGIDGHVHLRSPGEDHKEDWAHAQTAAFRGGVTTILDMPNNDGTHAVTSADRFYAKLEHIGTPAVDFRLWFGAQPANWRELAAVKRSPRFAGVKMYMEQSTGNLLLANPRDQYEWFCRAAEADVLLTLHVGDQAMIDKNRRDLPHPRIADHCIIRSAEVELCGGRRALELAEKTGCRIEIKHISTPQLQQEVTAATRRGVRVSSEICPHHWALDNRSLLREDATFFKMNPPLRTPEEVLQLQRALWEGGIDTVGTDHAPHTRQEKGASRYDDIPSGVPGLQEVLPLLLDYVVHGQMTLDRFVDLTSRNPARLYGLQQKGVLAPGHDADIILVNLAQEVTFTHQSSLSKCGWTPYHGRTVRGRVVLTVARGSVMYSELAENDRESG